ncbi:hypothetical protein BDV98DRAFT_603805 [Pterulicium gracile]|uniref:F-box domain-containing protein n=1 Tax=Pterulicium gracile TaxID=1884261 RepID=A0A5C3QM83_9AGAR|nr:hypothetical protein BDV98DRAFT_603805 [Pterula gracilis]
MRRGYTRGWRWVSKVSPMESLLRKVSPMESLLRHVIAPSLTELYLHTAGSHRFDTLHQFAVTSGTVVSLQHLELSSPWTICPELISLLSDLHALSHLKVEFNYDVEDSKLLIGLCWHNPDSPPSLPTFFTDFYVLCILPNLASVEFTSLISSDENSNLLQTFVRSRARTVADEEADDGPLCFLESVRVKSSTLRLPWLEEPKERDRINRVDGRYDPAGALSVRTSVSRVVF